MTRMKWMSELPTEPELELCKQAYDNFTEKMKNRKDRKFINPREIFYHGYFYGLREEGNASKE